MLGPVLKVLQTFRPLSMRSLNGMFQEKLENLKLRSSPADPADRCEIHIVNQPNPAESGGPYGEMCVC